MTTKTKFTNDLLTKQIQKLSEDALKPMSIIEIKEKFNLSFPFRVKRVKNSVSSSSRWFGVTTIHTIKLENSKLGGYGPMRPTYVTNNMDTGWSQNAEVQDYILYEEN